MTWATDAGFVVSAAYAQDPITTIGLSYTDITSRVKRFTTSRGRTHRQDTFPPGTSTITFDNHDLGFDPNSNADLVAGMAIKIEVKDSTATTRQMFTGFVKDDGISSVYQPHWSETTLDCQDALGWMAGRALPTLDPPAFEGYKLSEMVAAIAAAYPNIVPIDGGYTATVGLASMGAVPLGTDVLQFLQQLTLAEGGAVFVNTNGGTVIIGRTDVANIASSVTFDQTGATGVSWSAENFSMGFAPIYTTASVATLSDSAVYTYADTAATADHGEHAYPPITGAYMSSSSEAAALAERIVVSSSAQEWAPISLTLNPRKDSATLDAAVLRELLDVATIKTAKASGTQTSVCQVESISNTVDVGGGTWDCTVGFSSNDQQFANVDPAHWFILDDATTAALDGTRQLVW